MAKISLKKYVVIYQSQEHDEVLGYITASNIEEAITQAQNELKKEASFYEVEDVIIGEIRDEKTINFNIK